MGNTDRCWALLMAGPAQAGACLLSLQQKGKAEPSQIHSQSSVAPLKGSLFHRGMSRGTGGRSLSHKQTDHHTSVSSSTSNYGHFSQNSWGGNLQERGHHCLVH